METSQNRATIVIQQILADTGWDLAKLADASSYEERTLKRVMSGEINFSDRMEKSLQKAVQAAFPKMGEEPAKYGDRPQPRLVPIISKAQAGQLGEWDELPADQHEVIASDCPDPSAFALTIEGDSMQPEYKPGDIAIVMPNYTPTNESLVVARLTNGDVMFKRMVFLDTAGENFRLLSYNPLYPPFDVAADQMTLAYPVYSVVRKVWSKDKWQAQYRARRQES